MSKRTNKKARKIYEEYLKCKIPNGHEIHHIIPVELGGTDDIDNLLLMHSEDHKKVTLCYIKNFPTNDEILAASKALKYWMNVKENRIIPEPDNSGSKQGERQEFLKEHRKEVYECKLIGWSNVDLRELYEKWSNDEVLKNLNVNLGSISTLFLYYKDTGCKDSLLVEVYEKWCNNEVLKDYKGNLGDRRTLNYNYEKLEFENDLVNDSLNNIGIIRNSESHKGQTAWNKGKKGEPFSEDRKRKHKEALNKSEKIKENNRKNKNKRLLRYIRWDSAAANGSNMKKFCKKEGISISTFRRLINEFENKITIINF